MSELQSIAGDAAPQVLLVYHPMSEPTYTKRFPQGVRMNGVYFNTSTKARERDVQITLTGDIVLHLARTDKFPGWCYIQTKDTKAGCYTCTCYERRSVGDCVHVSNLEASEKIETLV